MKQFSRVDAIVGWLVAGLLIVGCQNKDAPTPVPQAPPTAQPAPVPEAAASPTGAAAADPYRTEIDELCHVVARSGADKEVGADRNYLIATYLGAKMKSSEGRAFLAKIQPLTGEPKAAAIEAEAARVGIPACPLANEWRKPAP